MTCREMLKIQHPNRYAHKTIFAWNMGCPHDYGYAPRPNCCLTTCKECWDREIVKKDNINKQSVGGFKK